MPETEKSKENNIESVSSAESNLESEDYERDVSDSSELTESVLKDIEKLKVETQKNNSMLKTLLDEHAVPLGHHSSSSSVSVESPRLPSSPRVLNQDFANMKYRIDTLERLHAEMLTKMNTELIIVLNKISDEMSLQSIKIEELQEQVALMKTTGKKLSRKMSGE
jgi:hypothetical protein